MNATTIMKHEPTQTWHWFSDEAITRCVEVTGGVAVMLSDWPETAGPFSDEENIWSRPVDPVSLA